jgi:pimeloyl-ACP methyl ester carboxylesterase
MFKAFRFLSDFSNALKQPESHPPTTRIHEASLNTVIYPNASARSTLILVPGLHPDGIFDRRMQAFAQACARAGFQVVAPDIEDFRNLNLTTHSIDLLGLLLNALPGYLPSSTLNNIGMLGISYGAGPVFLTASQNKSVTKVHFLIAIGGYGDFERSLLFATTGIYGTHFRKTQEYGRAIFALNHLEEFVRPENRDHIRDILLSKLPSAKQEAHLSGNKLPSTEQQFLKEVRDGFSDTNLRTTYAILERNRELWKHLSPITALNDLDPATRIYLIHGRNDDLVPYEETEEMARILQSRKFFSMHALTTASLSHVDIQRSNDLIGYVRLLFWLGSVLKEK